MPVNDGPACVPTADIVAVFVGDTVEVRVILEERVTLREPEEDVVAEAVLDTLLDPVEVPDTEELRVPLRDPVDDPVDDELRVPLRDPVDDPVDDELRVPLRDPVDELVAEGLLVEVCEALVDEVVLTKEVRVVDTVRDCVGLPVDVLEALDEREPLGDAVLDLLAEELLVADVEPDALLLGINDLVPTMLAVAVTVELRDMRADREFLADSVIVDVAE